jgi:putative molybdopterin biosynthesis protein
MKQRNIYIENTPLQEAQQLWRGALAGQDIELPLPAEEIPVDDALGRITSEAVYALQSSPFYHAAAMDGIAVRYTDTFGASETNPVRLAPDQYVAVNTGNALPPECNAVIMIEEVYELDNGMVEILQPVTPWNHVRVIGEDIVATELILPAGHLIRPIDQGAMLATGLTRVMVRRRPLALIIPTGSELVQPGSPMRPGNIIEFNSRILAGYLQEWGVDAHRSPIVTDDITSLRDAVRQAAASYDFVLLNAGASAGSEDYTSQILRDLGTVIVHGVNIKPGKPVILGLVNKIPVVGLPGYPVSAILSMHLFVRELVGMMLGAQLPAMPSLPATTARPLSSKLGVEEFVRVKLGRVGDNLMATPSGRGAGAVMSYAQADGILVIPATSEGVGAGEKVQVQLLRSPEEIDATLVFIGSHDNILDILANYLFQVRPAVRLSSAHVGSMGGIMAVKRGEAHLAGSHLLDEESGEYNIPFVKKYLAGMPLKLLNLAYREQGLLVPRGNPLKVRDMADLKRPEITFINRQRGAGTRLLTDMHLKRMGIEPANVSGYEREEYTHMAVAQAVASGSAATGMAIRAAAVALHLDFIPVAQERYDLIFPEIHADDRKVQALLHIIRDSDEFRTTVKSLGGYDLRDCGRILYEQ